MDNLTKLLEQLAIKLGTTSQYLWGVLIRQAKVAAITELLLLLLSITLMITTYKVHRYLMKPRFEGNNYERTYYDKSEEYVVFPMILLSITFTIFFLIELFCIGTIINGFLNPEYWALKSVLDTIK